MSLIHHTKLTVPPPIKLRYPCPNVYKRTQHNIQTISSSNNSNTITSSNINLHNKHSPFHNLIQNIPSYKHIIHSFKDTKSKQNAHLSPIPPSKRFTLFAKIISKPPYKSHRITSKSNNNIPTVLLSSQLKNKPKNEQNKNNNSIIFHSSLSSTSGCSRKRNYNCGLNRGISKVYLTNSTSLNQFNSTITNNHSSNNMSTIKAYHNTNKLDHLKILKIHKQLFNWLLRFIKDNKSVCCEAIAIGADKDDYLNLIKKYFILIQNIHFSNTDIEVIHFNNKDPNVYKLYIQLTKLQLIIYSVVFIFINYISLDNFANVLKTNSNLLVTSLAEFNKLFTCFYGNYFISCFSSSSRLFNSQRSLYFKNYVEYETIIKHYSNKDGHFRNKQSKNQHESNLLLISNALMKCGNSIKTFISKIINDNHCNSSIHKCFKPLNYIYDTIHSIKTIISLISNHILLNELNSLSKHTFSLINRISLSNSIPYLPQINNSKYKYSLVVDLDETLIHSFILNDNENAHTFHVRPFCFEFLNELSTLYEIIIFTAGTKKYADPIINQLDKTNKIISYKLYREHLSYDDDNGSGLKDLSKIGRDLKRTIIIDNIADNYILQKDNGLVIKTWEGNFDDRELFDLKNVLREIVNVFNNYEDKGIDIRKVINMINKEVNGRLNMERPYKDIKCLSI